MGNYDRAQNSKQPSKSQEQMEAERSAVDEGRRKHWVKYGHADAKRCALCFATGFVEALATDGYLYAFRCRACDSAELLSLSPSIPEWQGQDGLRPRTRFDFFNVTSDKAASSDT